ncbi:CHAT domain-containing protein [Brasilonema sp. CT11]|nr:CHAT domain-containing protein [Brasilonema sp. CT11]
MTQEFHISVTPVGQNDYLVRTEQVAPGVPLAEELVTWPVGDWLTAAGHLMNDPLKSVLQGDALARNSVNLVALGQQLYNALFQGTLRDSWITAQGIAQNHQQVLRLRLGLKDTKLARLPWEVMHAGDRPIATGPYIAFSRYQNGIGRTSRLPSTGMPAPAEEGGLKVLMAIASPTDLVRLDLLKQEAIKLQAELQPGESGNYLPHIELTLLEQPGREELTQALEQGRYHVLHYSGHSNISPNGGEIYLVSSRTGLRETLSGDDLAGLLVNNNIQMAVFNSCLGTYAATSSGGVTDTGERNLTESLVRRGIRSVLAMSERIPDEVALLLTQLFYRNLSHGYPVDLCVSRMRQGLIAAYGSHQLYWALPILYLQPGFDGYLSPEISLPQDEELFNEYNPSLKTSAIIYSEQANDASMPLPLEDMLPSSLARDSFDDLDLLGEETWGDLIDEIEYDDPTYEEDSAIVSDLFRQLDKQNTSEQSSMKAELVQFGEDSLDDKEVSGEIASLENDTGMWEEVREAASYGRQQGADPRELPSNSELSRQQELDLPEDWENSNVQPLAQTTTIRRTQTAKPKQGKRRRVSRDSIGVSAIALAGTALCAIAAVVSLNWWSHNQQIPVFSSTSQQQTGSTPQANFKTTETKAVSAIATDKLSQGDLQTGLQAVEELLNRNVLPNAQAALNAIPEKFADNALVYFLKGRLAWQFIQTGDNRYSVDDARRYWESALKAQPDSILYNNALGFAYYAQGNLNRANDSWFKALSFAVREQQSKSAASATTFLSSKPVPRDALTAYAGLAIGLYKTANNQPDGKRQQYLNEAIKLRQMIVKDDPVNFGVEELGKNWLWTQNALQDWKTLLQLKSQRSILQN